MRTVGEDEPQPPKTQGDRNPLELVITGTVGGSFGFTLEARYHDPSIPAAESRIGKAMKKTNEILLAAVQSDEALAEATASVGVKSLEKAYDFIKFLADSQSTCTIELFGKKVIL
jgi:hypothetical protein